MRNKDLVWDYFYENGSKYLNDSTHKTARCKAELEAETALLRSVNDAMQFDESETIVRDQGNLNHAALANVNPICGKVDSMINHLLECDKVSSELQTRMRTHQEQRKLLKDATAEIKKTQEASTSVANQDMLLGPSTRPNLAERDRLDDTQQNQFNQDLCDLFVACGIPWYELSNPIFKRFFKKWVPEASVPNRQAVSDRILPERVITVERLAQQDTQGKLAMGQCDGWKTIARDPVIAMLMTVEGQVYILRTHHVGASRKTAEHLVGLIKINLQEAQEKYGVEWVGWCTDSSSESKKARRLLYEEMPYLMNPDCAAHQINLLVAQYLKIKSNFVADASKAQQVIKWFNNHSRALAWLHEEQQHTIQKCLSLLYPMLSRWTSVYMSLKRLLDCLPAFQALLITRTNEAFLELVGPDRNAREKALEIRGIISSSEFWTNITRISLHLEPLTIAAHILEAGSTRLDEVCLTLANLHRIYSSLGSQEASVVNAMCAGILNLWLGMDQDVFILAVFLNPYIRGDLFNKLSKDGEFLRSGLTLLVIRVWKRLFAQSGDPDSDFLKACADYYNRSPGSIFSDSSMNLAMQERIAHAEGRDVDILDVWQQLDDTTHRGRNCLVKLGLRVFSVSANSAGCERLESVRNAIVLRSALMHKCVDEADRMKTLKRKARDFEIETNQTHTNSALSESETDESLYYNADLEQEFGGEEASTACYNSDGLFSELSKRLIQDLNDDIAATAALEGSLYSRQDPRMIFNSGTFGRKSRLPISDVFNFSATVKHSIEDTNSSGLGRAADTLPSSRVDFYWGNGMRNVKLGLMMLARFQAEKLGLDYSS